MVTLRADYAFVTHPCVWRLVVCARCDHQGAARYTALEPDGRRVCFPCAALVAHNARTRTIRAHSARSRTAGYPNRGAPGNRPQTADTGALR